MTTYHSSSSVSWPTRLLVAWRHCKSTKQESCQTAKVFFSFFFFFFRCASSKLQVSLTMVFAWNSSILHQPITFSQLWSNLMKCCKDTLKYGFIGMPFCYLYTCAQNGHLMTKIVSTAERIAKEMAVCWLFKQHLGIKKVTWTSK